MIFLPLFCPSFCFLLEYKVAFFFFFLPNCGLCLSVILVLHFVQNVMFLLFFFLLSHLNVSDCQINFWYQIKITWVNTKLKMFHFSLIRLKKADLDPVEKCFTPIKSSIYPWFTTYLFLPKPQNQEITSTTTWSTIRYIYKQTHCFLISTISITQ